VVRKVVQVLPQSRPQRRAVEAEQKLIQLQKLPQQAAEAAANSAVCTINVPEISGRREPPANPSASKTYMAYCGPGSDDKIHRYTPGILFFGYHGHNDKQQV
jgi:hypothetical protein